MRWVSTRVLPDPRHDEERPVDVGDRLRLDRVEALEERVVGGAHDRPPTPPDAGRPELDAAPPPSLPQVLARAAFDRPSWIASG